MSPNSLVVEHRGLADAKTQARAAKMGCHVLIQQPLRHDAVAVQMLYFGKERTARLFPARN